MSGHFVPVYVVLSVLVAIFVSHTALSLAARLASRADGSGAFWLLGGAVAMGGGVWSMHFIGMLAFNSPVGLSHDPLRTGISLLIATVVSGLALRIASRPRLGAASLAAGGVAVGVGISAMHYTGMSAIRMTPAPGDRPGLALLSVAVAVTASLVALWMFFQLRTGGSRQLRATRLGAAVVMGGVISGMHYIGMAASYFALGFGTGAHTTSGDWLAATIAIVAFALLTIMSLLLTNDANLEHAATHDALTALPNRVLLTDRMTQAAAHAERTGGQFAVLLLDLDRFKSVNDSLGHRAGDELLRTIALRVEALLRRSDTLARLGGDEFVIVLDQIATPMDVEQVVTKVLEQIAMPMMISGIELCTTASIGICVAPGDGRAADTLLQRADAAMYQAKKAGRGQFRFFSSEMGAFARERLELESALRHALARGEFELHYQPKIETETQQIRGAEALIRWRHPTRGLLPPAQFMPLADETGLMVPIGEWVLEEACRQTRLWHLSGAPGLKVSVNLSAQQFAQNNLCTVVERALTRSGLEAGYLELELTESSIMSDAERALRVLNQLKHLGVQVSVDDFGTGYSSLSYLRRMPIDRLKIDRTFVRDVSTNPEDAEIVRAIIALAHTLQLKVVAEGVETREQLDVLRTLGCDQYQGFHYSAPINANAFRELMQQRRPRDKSSSVISLEDSRRERTQRP